MDAEQLGNAVRERLRRPVASIEPIEAGMGARRFFRLHFREGEPRTLIARCEPEPASATAPAARPSAAGPEAPIVPLPPAPAWLPEPPLEPLRSFLERAGVRVPKSYGHDPELGLDLLEDIGSHTLLRADRSQREALYREACAFVPRLQALTAPAERIPAFGRRYDRALVDTKCWKWLHWAIPGLLGRPATPSEQRDTRALFAAIADLLEDAPRRLAHRDFKAENIHLLPARAGSAATSGLPELVLIDVQGAFVAPPEYDLVCLLDDLQTDLDEELAARLLAEVLPDLPDRTPAELARRRFDAIAVARLCKDVSHVIHAGQSRGDRRRWHEIPRGLDLLGRAAGRLERRLPGIASLNTVILALTRALEATDIAGKERAR